MEQAVLQRGAEHGHLIRCRLVMDRLDDRGRGRDVDIQPRSP